MRSPASLSNGLDEALSTLFGGHASFSVRSSIVGEDSAEHSYAGQMDSFLNIPKSAVEEAVKKVWASAFSVRALVYRQRAQIGFDGISAAVIVQEMIVPYASGVLFSHDPRSGESRCVIAAGFGVGEGVVANKVETDTYTVSRDLVIVCRDIPLKERQMVFAESGGVRAEPLPPERQRRQILSEEQIRELAMIGARGAQYFGSPQDMEWAFDAQGRLFVLQSRPIVFRQHSSAKGKTVRVWDNANIVEGYPGITLPLTFSFIRNCYEHLLRNATLGFLLRKKDIGKDLGIFTSMVGLLNGRIYYNLPHWYKMMSYLPGYEQYRKSWDEMIGIQEGLACPAAELSSINRCYGWGMAIFRLLTLRRNAEVFSRLFDRFYQKYGDLDFAAADVDDLMATYETMERELLQHWHLTLYNDYSAIKYYDWLKRLSERWGLVSEPNLYNDLLCGEEGVESVAVVHALMRIAEMFQADSRLKDLLTQKDDREMWEYLSGEDAPLQVQEALKVYLQRYGDRAAEELKLEKSSYRDDPAALVGLIRNYVSLGLSVDRMSTENRQIRNAAERKIRHPLASPWKRLVFGFVLANTRSAIANRENMRFRRSRIFGLARRLFLRMGQLWCEQGILHDAQDIFYLTVEDIFGFCRGTSVNHQPMRLVEIRRSEYERFAHIAVVDRFRTEGIPTLSAVHGLETWPHTSNTLQGVGCVSGIASGTARVIHSPAEQAAGDGDFILVTKSTDPGWVFLMVMSKGLVVEKGSLLSHTAIIGRELGIPTIVGVKDATRQIPDGARIIIDGGTGEIRWLL